MPEWFFWSFFGVCLLAGFLAGALWGSEQHLRSIRRHIAWIEDYTASVNKLLSDIATAIRKRGGA